MTLRRLFGPRRGVVAIGYARRRAANDAAARERRRGLVSPPAHHSQHHRTRASVGYRSDGDQYALMLRIASQADAHNAVIQTQLAIEKATGVITISVPYMIAWAQFYDEWAKFFDRALPTNVLGYYPADEQEFAEAVDFNDRLGILLAQWTEATGIPTVPPAQVPGDRPLGDRLEDDAGLTEAKSQTALLIGVAGVAAAAALLLAK